MRLWTSFHRSYRWVLLQVGVSGWPFSEAKYFRIELALLGWQFEACVATSKPIREAEAEKVSLK